MRSLKTPTTPPHFADGVLTAIRLTNTAPGNITDIAHGMTVATNTALEMNGAKLGVITTRGFRDVLVVGLPQGEPSETAKDLEQRFAGLTDALKQQEFKGKPGDQLVITPLAAGLQRLVVLGLGEADGVDANALRGAVARAAKAAIGCEGSLGIQLPWAGIDAAEAARISAEAIRLCLYKDQRFRKEPDPRRVPESLALIGLAPEASQGFATVNATCAGVELARELVAAPPNVVTPQALADTAAGIAQEHGLELKVLEGNLVRQ